MMDYDLQQSPTRTGKLGSGELAGYLEGLWTPSVDDPAGGAATYTVQTGSFTRIGRLVFFRGRILINTILTGSTTNIFGLPFPSLRETLVNARVINDGATAIVSSCGRINQGGRSITFASRTAASVGDDFTIPIFKDSTGAEVSGCYEI